MPKRRTAAVPPRVRRSADEARTAIMDATERRLVAGGTAGIRLQDVAGDVGIAHPTILHHFGSRERLVAAVVQRRVEAMNAEVLAAVAAGPTDDLIGSVLARLFDAFDRGGHARVVAFMALEGQANPALEGIWPLVRALHDSGVAPDRARAELVVLLVTYALFGEAIAGPTFRAEPPERPDPKARARFLSGLATLVRSLLAPRPPDPPPPAPATRVRRPSRAR